jgi:ASC-1-like (ASCH) protein
MQHIAIMRKSRGLTSKILSGQKTIESRWYKNRYAPWDKIEAGETIYFKDSSEPIKLKATVRKVLQWDNLTPAKVDDILKTYGSMDGLAEADLPAYYNLFKDKHYCLLIFLCDVQTVKPFYISKAGYGAMAAWISVESVWTLVVS